MRLHRHFEKGGRRLRLLSDRVWPSRPRDLDEQNLERVECAIVAGSVRGRGSEC